MKSALSDFILGKKGIYGILHIIILVMSLFLVISISVDTFKGIPFYTQSSYMKTQLWICIWFLFDFVLEFFLAKHKGRYLRTHFIFLLYGLRRSFLSDSLLLFFLLFCIILLLPLVGLLNKIQIGRAHV